LNNELKKQKITNNNWFVLSGGVFAVLNILFFTGLFQLIVALLFGVNNFYLEFNTVILAPVFSFSEHTSVIAYGFIYLSPITFNIILLELGTALLKKTSLGSKRFSLIVFNLIIAGYLIINVFYGTAISLLTENSGNDWSQLMLLLNIHGNGKIFFMFAVILLLTFELKQTAKRILEYIN